MRKTSKTFLTVGAILGFVFGAIFAILGITLAVVGKTNDPQMLEPFQSFIDSMYGGSVAKFQQAALVYGITLVICGICSIVSGVFCHISKNKRSAGMFVAVIVLCALGGSIFGLLGAIFGLIANGQENRQQPQNGQMQ